MLVRFAEFELNTARRELRQAGRLISIEPKVFDLLAHVIANRDRVVGKDELIAVIWDGRIVSESAMTTCINAARTAIGDSGAAQRLIKTLPRKGIRFVADVRTDNETPRIGTPADVAGRLVPRTSLPDRPSIAVLPFLTSAPILSRNTSLTALLRTSLQSCRECVGCS